MALYNRPYGREDASPDFAAAMSDLEGLGFQWQVADRGRLAVRASGSAGGAPAARARTVSPSEHPREHGRKKAVARTFSMHTTADRPSLLARAKRVAKENGAILVGDERSGRFSHGMFGGVYRMAGPKVVVTVTYKHWLLSWSVVESRLRDLFRSSPFAARPGRPARVRKRRRRARRSDGP